MKLYVGNLPWSVDESKLKEIFSSFGNITEAVLIKDKFSGRSKGFGFITFENDEEAQKAISEMHEKDVEGRPLTVSEAKPMVPRDNAPRAKYSSESSEAPIANPAEIVNENSETETTEEEIETVEEAKENANSDEPATEEATEAEESSESEEIAEEEAEKKTKPE
ncbi:RNA-binding protein [Candidatus Pacearchaeota archaeon]|nr:RNA-binding protein [Candidatus Pacearchaeota archaeon]